MLKQMFGPTYMDQKHFLQPRVIATVIGLIVLLLAVLYALFVNSYGEAPLIVVIALYLTLVISWGKGIVKWFFLGNLLLYIFGSRRLEAIFPRALFSIVLIAFCSMFVAVIGVIYFSYLKFIVKI